MSIISDPEERRVLFAALDSFRQYRQAAHYNITHLRRQAFYSLPAAHVDMLSEPPFSLPQTFRDVDDAIDCNADIADAVLASGLEQFGINPDNHTWHGAAKPSDVDKCRSTIRQLYRDWSAEAAPEREAVYAPIFEALGPQCSRIAASGTGHLRVLVPGAGLGRLAWELAGRGYESEGNEISYHQLIASHYILNRTAHTGQHNLYPWALAFSNHLTRANQLRAVSIPDVDSAALLDSKNGGSLHMTAGDFCALYREPRYAETFDAVVTCFFIDTAPNVIEYIETVKHCLKSGGIWVNVGPLLWHFEAAPTPAERRRDRERRRASPDMEVDDDDNVQSREYENSGIGAPGSFELSNDEVVALVQKLGFEIVEHVDRLKQPAGYIQDSESMLQNTYRPSLWVARKLLH
ncbi:hypothetical protein B0A48_16524 [Cryoendolithus antarcticus]|uniref:carnosine N-methyltransferase n=1 Tax=Cryoendolithus antarcticus TaxID=1507870 RepID=A0A1V8SFA7_9PEZI|nr:hypothetical protein B0A48_16524 [Cryoendolithus antarcticus]